MTDLTANISTGNLFADVPAALPEEHFDILASAPQLRIERIVSTGHATAEGDWYDQESDEWVALLAGAAELLFEGEAAPRALSPGDWVLIPAHVRHRVESTTAAEPTVWLAVHFAG